MNSPDEPGPQAIYDSITSLLASRPSGSDDSLSVLENLCSAAAARLSASGASLNLMSVDGLDGVIAAADPVSRHRAELQFTTGEGPCHDAYMSRHHLMVPDVSRETGRWPGYATAAAEAGAMAVFAFPLEVAGRALGVLEIFNDQRGSLEQHQLEDALIFARVATDVLLEQHLVTTDGELESSLASAMGPRAEVHQAQGMLAISSGVGLDQALVLMRAHAFARTMSLVAVARAVKGGDNLENEQIDDGA